MKTKETEFKKRKPIKCEKNENMRFFLNSSEMRKCDFCGGSVDFGEPVFTLGYFFVTHLGCVENFCEMALKFKKGKTKELIIAEMEKGNDRR